MGNKYILVLSTTFVPNYICRIITVALFPTLSVCWQHGGDKSLAATAAPAMAIPALHHGRAAPGDPVRPGPLPAADGPAASSAQGTSLGDGLLQGPRVPGMNHALITAPWAKERGAKAAPGEQPGRSRCCSELEGPLHLTRVPWQPPSSPWVPGFHTEEGWWDGVAGPAVQQLWQCLAHGTRCQPGDGRWAPF